MKTEQRTDFSNYEDHTRERSRSPISQHPDPELTGKLPLSLPPSLTITTKPKELESKAPTSPMMSPHQEKKHQTPLLQNMLTENPLMSAAMQQMMTAGGPGAGLPSSADLMQQAHALQLLAQLQSVLMMNNPLMSKIQQSQVGT